MNLLQKLIDYVVDKFKFERKIPDISSLVKKTECNDKITEIKGKTPNISRLATNAALTEDGKKT